MRSFLRIWSHLLDKSLMENIIFCAVINAIKHQFNLLEKNMADIGHYILMLDMKLFILNSLNMFFIFQFCTTNATCQVRSVNIK